MLTHWASLAQVAKHVSPESLLDTYQAERHPPTARSLQGTMAAGALHRGDPRTKALRDQLTELAAELYAADKLSAACVGADEAKFRAALAPVSETLVAA